MIEALAADARQDRMDRIAVLYAEITAATREFLRALAESDRHRDWAEAGFGSCADWLAWRIGVTRDPRPAGAGAPASEKVRAARALEDLPLISEAMAQGEISEYRTEVDMPIEATMAALKALDRGRVADPPAADAA